MPCATSWIRSCAGCAGNWQFLAAAGLFAAGLLVAWPARAQTEPPSAATPTVDRLAAPPTVEAPTQADEGAQLYWLNCQPCHGDQGQGLTDEWRAQYPPEDQNCWLSGCHGRSPYENGFTLPTAVPALIGPRTLARFATVADLHAYLSRAMPYNAPGSLTPEAYWAITAFLARAHGLPEQALPLDSPEAAAAYPLGVSVPAATATPVPAQPVTSLRSGALLGWAGSALMVLAALGGLAVWLRRRRA